MTLAQLRPDLSRYLGIYDVTQDGYYNSNYLAAINRAQQLVGLDLHTPMKSATVSVAGPTVNLPSDARQDLVFSIVAENPSTFGSRQLQVMEIDEALRLLGTLTQPAGTPPPRIAIMGQGPFISVYPSQGVTTNYTLTYVSVPTDLALDTDVVWGGLSPSYHYMVAMMGAMLLLLGDGPGESFDRYTSLANTYVLNRQEAYMHLHPNRDYAPASDRTVLPETPAGKDNVLYTSPSTPFPPRTMPVPTRGRR